jgi:hypothetical protein
MKNIKFLIALANQLDLEGQFEKADLIDENFEEFLKLLGEGKIQFDFTFSGSPRDPRGPYGNFGTEVSIFEI